MKPAFMTRIVCLLALLALLCVGASAQPGYRFEPLHFPSAYVAGDGGLLVQGESYVSSITNNGTLLGWWGNNLTGEFYNMRTRRGEDLWATLPSVENSYLTDINTSGTWVGNYITPDGLTVGYIRKPSGEVITYYADPNTLYTIPYALAESGLALAVSGDELTISWFLIRPDGTRQSLGYLGQYGPNGGYGWYDVNNSGTLVGYYYDGNEIYYPVIGHGAEITRIIIPGAIGVNGVKINNRGEVAGTYVTYDPTQFDPYHSYGFVRDTSGKITTVAYVAPWPQTITTSFVWGTFTGNFYSEHGTEITAQNERGQLVGNVGAFYSGCINNQPAYLFVVRHFIATPANPGNH